MAKIHYKVDGKGVLQASADVALRGRLVKVAVQAATTPEEEKGDMGVWAQVTFDLFSAKETLQTAASKLGTED